MYFTAAAQPFPFKNGAPTFPDSSASKKPTAIAVFDFSFLFTWLNFTFLSTWLNFTTFCC